VVANGFEESLQRVLGAGCWSELRSFGPANADFVADGPAHDFAVQSRGTNSGNSPRVQWGLSGVFNQHNALAAIAAAEHVGVTVAQSCAALGSFQNVKRRLEVFATVQPHGDKAAAPITIYDDFAHHPTAIRLTLEGLRARLGEQTRILAIFEPRSNTMKLGTMKAQLPWSLEAADLAFCHSGGLDWDAAEALKPLGSKAQTHDNIAALVQAVARQARAGDVLVCMSNGSFGGVHAKLREVLAAAG
jgi:UDP-N-acetylmuramate: L-alanyl-gamma-D-glutamyl-meso-diaminopimelate ligase